MYLIYRHKRVPTTLIESKFDQAQIVNNYWLYILKARYPRWYLAFAGDIRLVIHSSRITGKKYKEHPSERFPSLGVLWATASKTLFWKCLCVDATDFSSISALCMCKLVGFE